MIKCVIHLADVHIRPYVRLGEYSEVLSTFIDQGYTPEEIMKEILSDFEMEITGKLELEYLCDCSRKRVEKVLISLGEKEIEKIIEEDGESEVKCHFCNTNYHFSKEELEKILLTIKD